MTASIKQKLLVYGLVLVPGLGLAGAWGWAVAEARRQERTAERAEMESDQRRQALAFIAAAWGEDFALGGGAAGTPESFAGRWPGYQLFQDGNHAVIYEDARAAAHRLRAGIHAVRITLAPAMEGRLDSTYAIGPVRTYATREELEQKMLLLLPAE